MLRIGVVSSKVAVAKISSIVRRKFAPFRSRSWIAPHPGGRHRCKCKKKKDETKQNNNKTYLNPRELFNYDTPRYPKPPIPPTPNTPNHPQTVGPWGSPGAGPSPNKCIFSQDFTSYVWEKYHDPPRGSRDPQMAPREVHTPKPPCPRAYTPPPHNTTHDTTTQVITTHQLLLNFFRMLTQTF